MDQQLLFECAKKAGFEECELYYVSKSDTTIKVSEGEVDKHQMSSTHAVCFRGLIDGKMGYAYTEKIDNEAIDRLVHTAKECALLVEKEDVEFIYEGKEACVEIESYDTRIAEMSTYDQIEMALSLEEKAKGLDERLEKISDCGVGIGTTQVRISNSRGMDRSHKISYISTYVAPIAKDGEARVNDSEVMMATCMDSVDTEALAQKAVSKTVRKIGASSIPSGKYRVVFENDMMSTMISVMQSAFFADVMQEGKSLLKGKVGEHIASAKVNLVDDPHLTGGLASRGFDDEGVPTKRKYLVEEGQFKGFLHNLKTAYKEGVETTGNASKGSIAAPVKVDSTNLYLEKGSISLEALLKQADTGLYITNLEGVHAGANSITGDFSLAARGLLIEDGKLTRGVKQITIAGNFFDLLQDIEEVADDLKLKGSIGSPSVLVSELSVAGE